MGNQELRDELQKIGWFYGDKWRVLSDILFYHTGKQKQSDY